MATNKKVDINKASVEKLEALAGIGRSKAETIVEQRDAQGGFNSIADLKKIPGIGQSILDRNKGTLHCSTNRNGNKRATKVSERETRSSVKQERHTEKATSSASPKSRCLRSVIASRTRSHSSSDVHNDSDLKSDPKDPLPEEQGGGMQDEEDREVIFKQNLGARGPADGEESVQTHSEDEDESSRDGEGVGVREEASVLARIPAPSLSTHKLWMKRKRDSESDGNTDKMLVSPDKKPCRDGESSSSRSGAHSNSYQFGTIKTGSSCPAPSIRKRIPSKNNPPPELEQWLKTFQTWSHPERLLALDELMTMCEPTEVRHVMSVIEPQFQRDFISLLPKELALYVLSFLDPKDLLKAAQTCRNWRILAEDNLLWKEKCQEESIDEQLVYENRLRRRSLQSAPPFSL